MHQSALMGSHWASRRKASSHPAPTLRRACTTDAAQWNVQVVKGKVTTRCLWNACKALTIGLALMMLGCTMAVIGYYADQLSVNHEVRGNSTVRVKNESRGFHLNNLSYAGPIVMGVGGFIVVAACVMTFEARDNAAKVVPARLKYNPNAKPSPSGGSQKHVHHRPASQRSDSGRRNQTCQTGRWDNHAGLFRSNNPSSGHVDAGASPCGSEAVNRRALTAAFVQFSRALQDQHIANEARFGAALIKRSPSAPNLSAEVRLQPLALATAARPAASPGRRSRASGVQPRPSAGGCAFLSPYALQRQALSMDNPAYDGCPCHSPPSLSRQRSRQSGGGGSRESMELGASAGVSGSQASMAMDLHLPNDWPVTLAVRDRSRRSDTAKKHVFARQRPVEDEGEARSCSPRMTCRYARSNTEDSRGSERSGSRSAVDGRYRYRQDSAAAAVAAVGKARRSESRYRKRTSYAHPIAASRSNDEETRRRRESITTCDRYQRRRSSNQTINHYSRANTDDSGHQHSDGSPYSISRANTEDETRNSNEFELCYLKTDCSSTLTIESETRVATSDPATENTMVKVDTLERDVSRGAKPKRQIGPDEVIEDNGGAGC